MPLFAAAINLKPYLSKEFVETSNRLFFAQFQGRSEVVTQVPFFGGSTALKPFIPHDFEVVTQLIEFRTKSNVGERRRLEPGMPIQERCATCPIGGPDLAGILGQLRFGRLRTGESGAVALACGGVRPVGRTAPSWPRRWPCVGLRTRDCAGVRLYLPLLRGPSGREPWGKRPTPTGSAKIPRVERPSPATPRKGRRGLG